MTGTPPYGGYTPPQPMRPEDERLWATLVHVGGILFGFLAPLVGYFVLRDRGPFIKEHTRIALNFQLTVLIGYIVSAALTAAIIGFFLYPAVGVLALVFAIIAAVAANRGQWYRYPISIEFIKA